MNVIERHEYLASLERDRMVSLEAEQQACDCLPCPGRGNDGHGLTHCAECCFGTGVEGDIDCPVHGVDAISKAQA